MLAFRVARLIDGTGAKPLEQATLLVEGERILALGHQADLPIPEGATVIDAPTASLMPGMVDVHVHLAYSGKPHKRAFRAEGVDLSYPLMALRAAAHARATLKAGFTAVRDLNAPGGVIIDLRDAVSAGYVAGPRIKAKGLGHWKVVFKHALRNAMIPPITLLGIQFALLIGGAVITETVFARPGLGQLLVTSVLQKDIPMVQALVVYTTGAYILLNFIVDLLYGVIDPRIRDARTA